MSKNKSKALVNIETSIANPMLVYRAETSLACTYALRRPSLAIKCAKYARDAAIAMKRPDLTFHANCLITAIKGDR